jgi:hypothetical protein
VHRPGLYRNHLGPHVNIFLNGDRTIGSMVPHRRVIGAIHHVNLNFHGAGKWWKAFVFGMNFELISLALLSISTASSPK